MEKITLPDLSLAVLEKAFPRTFLALPDLERKRVAREFLTEGDAARNLHKLPECLAQRKWPQGMGYLPDLAELEYALRIANLAPDTERVGFEAVTTASEPEWYAARFRFDPAHRILETEWPLELIYHSPQGAYAPQRGLYLVFRTNGKAQFRPLDENECQLIQSLSLGVPLGRVLERNRGPEFDAMTFHRWIESGLLRAIHWAAV